MPWRHHARIQHEFLDATVVRSRRAIRLAQPLFVGLVGSTVVIFVAIYFTATVTVMYSQMAMNDFGKFYYSARAFLEGGDMYGPTPATAFVGRDVTRQLWNMNPPHFHLLVLPLALLPPLVALLGWSALSVLALGLSLHLITRELRLAWRGARLAWAVIAVLCCSATGTVVVTGQLAFLLMVPMTLAWRDMRQHRWSRAAVMLGVVVSLKPFLGLFALWFTARRRWSCLGWMVLGSLLGLVPGVVVFGWRAYAGWIDVLGRVDWTWSAMNASVHGVLTRTLMATPVFIPLVDAPQLAGPGIVVVCGLLIGATAWVLVHDPSGNDADRGFAASTLLSLLVSPLGWIYYLWLAAGPLAALVNRIELKRVTAAGVLVAGAVPGLLMPFFLTVAWSGYAWGSITLGSIYGWTVLALLGVTLAVPPAAASTSPSPPRWP